MIAIRFYLDENAPVAIAEQLKRRHIEAITVRDLKELGDKRCKPSLTINCDGLCTVLHTMLISLCWQQVVPNMRELFSDSRKSIQLGIGCVFCRNSMQRFRPKIFVIACNFCKN